MGPLTPGPKPIHWDLEILPTKQHICPKCKKDYGDIFGLWFSSIIRNIHKTERKCKMCGYTWYTL